jgi:hypothetical protein
MSTPRLERALAAIAAQCETILTASDFHTNAGQRVFRQRSTFVVEELPCISVNFISATPSDGASNVITWTASIGIDVHVEADQANTGTQMILGMADIEACIGLWTYSLGVRDADDAGVPFAALNFTGAEPVEREDGAVSEGMRVAFDLIYTVGRGTPDKPSRFAP